MSEYVDEEYEYVDEDEDEDDFEEEGDPRDARLTALENQYEAAERNRQINAALHAFEDEHGIQLDRQTAQKMGELIDTDGWDVVEAYNEVSPAAQNFEADFDENVERLEREQGRTLLDSEVDKLWDHAVDRHEPEHVEPGSTLDLDKKGDLEDYIDRRVGGEPDEPEAVAPLAADATPDQITEHIDAIVSGAPIATTDEGD